MCWIRSVVVCVLDLFCFSVSAQVMQFNKYRAGIESGFGFATGKRQQGNLIGSMYGKKLNLSVPYGFSFCRNVSEYFWISSGIHYQQTAWNFYTNKSHSPRYQPAAEYRIFEERFFFPLEAVVYSGHEQGRVYFAAGAGPVYSLRKLLYERNETMADSTFSTVYNETGQVSRWQYLLRFRIGTEFEVTDDLLCQIGADFRTGSFWRRNVGRESTSMLAVNVAFHWVF